MTILYIIHSCIMGGATISFLNLIRGMAAQGCRIIVVHPKPNPGEETLMEELRRLGCKCVCLNVATSYRIMGKSKIKYWIKPLYVMARRWWFYRQLLKVAKQERPNIIHTNTGVVHDGFRVAKKMGIPHVWHLREYQDIDFKMQPLPSMEQFRQTLRQSHTVCITKDIQRHFGLTDCINSTVIYNPAMSETDVQDALHDQDYFLVANRISREKGIDIIISTFAKICDVNKTYSLKIAGFGNPEYVAKLKTMCTELGIARRVEFLGYTNDVRALMLHAKALVVASYNEGFGRMTAEANMMGLPVIGRNTAGTLEILSQTSGGILFATKDELIHAMQELAAMPPTKVQGMMLYPQSKAMELFSNEQHISEMTILYNKINGGGTQCNLMCTFLQAA